MDVLRNLPAHGVRGAAVKVVSAAVDNAVGSGAAKEVVNEVRHARAYPQRTARHLTAWV